MSDALLSYYCVLILLASVLGGMVPHWVQLTHRRMELAVSCVAGVMLGVALLHMLPHAISAKWDVDRTINGSDLQSATVAMMVWTLVGFLAMFLIERFFCYHHHEVPGEEQVAGSEGHVAHAHSDHTHDITWSGAAIGLTLHSLLAGVALAAAVAHGGHGGTLAGLGTFLVIFLHKPLDSMTISMLMARGGWSPVWRHTVNGLFALAIPVGVVMFRLGIGAEPGSLAESGLVPPALAFSAGMFLCISMSDLLPELQFHQHDRVKLTLALVLGLLVAYGAGQLEAWAHGEHQHATSQQTLMTESQ